MTWCCVLLLVLILLYASIADFRSMRIRNGVNFIIMSDGIIYRYINGGISAGIISAAIIAIAIYFVFFAFKIFGKTWLMGGGDIKMLTASAFWLEPDYIPMFLMAVGAVGVLFCLLNKIRVFPFAPAISIGLLFVLGITHINSTCAHEKRGNMSNSEKPFSCIHLKAKKQPAKKIVILMHGYGADADNMLSVAFAIANALEDADIFVPNGFDPCNESPSGFQWFSLAGWENSEDWRHGINKAAERLNNHLDLLLKKYGFGNSKLYLAGFSQGAMMALHVGIQRQVAGIVCFSGMLVDNSILEHKINTKVLLTHGDIDQVIPVSFCKQMEDTLKQFHIPVSVIVNKGVGHTISDTAINAACDFLKRH